MALITALCPDSLGGGPDVVGQGKTMGLSLMILIMCDPVPGQLVDLAALDECRVVGNGVAELAGDVIIVEVSVTVVFHAAAARVAFTALLDEEESGLVDVGEP